MQAPVGVAEVMSKIWSPSQSHWYWTMLVAGVDPAPVMAMAVPSRPEYGPPASAVKAPPPPPVTMSVKPNHQLVYAVAVELFQTPTTEMSLLVVGNAVYIAQRPLFGVSQIM